MTTQELQFFDTIASDWDNRETMSLPAKVAAVLDFIPIRAGDSVLDLGTGTGVLLPQLCKRVGAQGHVVAVDLSTKMLAIAEEKNGNLTPRPEFINADFERSAMPGKYDHIFLYCVYPHLDRPVETLRRLYEQNLKPGGEISIAFPCSEEVINHIHGEKRVDHSHLPSAPELAAYLTCHGLEAVAQSATEEIYMVILNFEC